MQNLSLHSSASERAAPDLAGEISRLGELLDVRRVELATLQEEFRAFKTRYTQIVGSRLAELSEIEQAIKEAEERLLGVEAEEEKEDEKASTFYEQQPARATGTGLRKLFWSVARMFHPDHAADEKEARRRHTIMAEASRAYREGDVDSLHTLLGDEGLQSYCAVAQSADEEDDLATRLLNLKEELRTVEFGLKRIRQDGMYRTMLSVEEEARQGRDALAAMAERIGRQIVKARHRLEHLT